MLEGALWSTIALELLFGWILSPSQFDFEWILSLQSLYLESRIAFGETCVKRFRLKNLLWWLGRQGADEFIGWSFTRSIINRSFDRSFAWAFSRGPGMIATWKDVYLGPLTERSAGRPGGRPSSARVVSGAEKKIIWSRRPCLAASIKCGDKAPPAKNRGVWGAAPPSQNRKFFEKFSKNFQKKGGNG